MSYFIASLNGPISSINELVRNFFNIIPKEIKNDTFSLRLKNSVLHVFGVQKAIKDYFYVDNDSKSWIAIIGMPILNKKYHNDFYKKLLLKEFLLNPQKIIQNEIDGCFSIIAFDAVNIKLYACTDYNNNIPIYYSTSNSMIFLSSHELPLAKLLKPNINILGFSMAIQLKVTWNELTRFENMNKLLPCQMIIFSGLDNTIKKLTYWNPSYEKLWKYKFDDIVYHWKGLLKEAISGFYNSSDTKKVLCDITGGEDSRLLLATLHSLKIPYIGFVMGDYYDLDLIIAKEISKKAGFSLIIKPRNRGSLQRISEHAINTSLFVDSYEDYFTSFLIYFFNIDNYDLIYRYIKISGTPGGEIFRGSYYLRGKIIFPSRYEKFNYKFFTKMKFLIDFYPDLFQLDDKLFLDIIYKSINSSLKEVASFPVGTKIDHLLKTYQSSNTGLIYKSPSYLPLATKQLIKSVYNIPPFYKQNSRLTRACTELMFPEIASIRTQKGIPTIRKNLWNFHKFIPEYLSIGKHIKDGLLTRLLKWKDPHLTAISWDQNEMIIKFLLTTTPYSKWLKSSTSMITGYLYNRKVLDSIIIDARENKTRFVSTLGRIISHELACRWVYNMF